MIDIATFRRIEFGPPANEAFWPVPIARAEPMSTASQRAWIVRHIAWVLGSDDLADEVVDLIHNVGCTVMLTPEECRDCGAEVTPDLMESGHCPTCHGRHVQADNAFDIERG
jgi:predicted Zn-ribbon and HTH transcriptional regulator